MDTPKALARDGDESVDLLGMADVDLHGKRVDAFGANGPLRCGEGIVLHVSQDDVDAPSSEGLGHGETYATSGAGDDCNLSTLEFHVPQSRPKLGTVHEYTFEAEISPGMTARQVIDLARLAEDAGFDRVGVSDVIFWPDCFVLLGLIARETQRVQLGPMVTNPYSRHPAVLAGIMATLQDASDGRAFLGLGVGAGLEAVGIRYPRPVAHLREAIGVIRSLLRGEVVDYAGTTVQVGGSRMVGPVASVPIAIGSRSAQVMRLAGELADTALVGGRYLSPSIAAQYRSWISEGEARAGRLQGEVEVAPRLTLCISSDGNLARRSVKRYVAHYVALIQPKELELDPAWLDQVRAALSRSTGWYFDLDRHDDPEIVSLISDDLVRRFAIAGTAEECVALARESLDLGFTSASFNLAAPVRESLYVGLRETLEGAGEFVSALRASSPRSS